MTSEPKLCLLAHKFRKSIAPATFFDMETNHIYILQPSAIHVADIEKISEES